MKRVLIVTEHNLTSLGGIQKVISDITTNLKSKYLFDVVTFESMNKDEKKQFTQYRNIFEIPCKVNQNGINRIFEVIKRPIRIRSNLNRIIKFGKYDVVHCHDIYKGGYALQIAERNNVPIRICQSHISKATDPKGILKKLYFTHMQKKLKYATVNIGVSKIAGEALFGNNDYIVIRNGTDLSRFNGKKSDLRDGKIRFIHVGRYSFQKNHEFLVNVFNYIHQELPETMLTLVGWGELEENIKTQIHNLHLDGCVKMLPANSDVAELMSQSDYMIFPSRYEGLSLVSLEAQAMNVMCFASDAITDEVKEIGLWKTFSLDIGEKAWAQYIIDYIRNDKRKQDVLNKEILREFDIRTVVQKYEKVYEGILK